jgi:hypothetical protein
MGGITDSTKRYGFWKKSSMNWSGVFYIGIQNFVSNPKLLRGFLGLQVTTASPCYCGNVAEITQKAVQVAVLHDCL